VTEALLELLIPRQLVLPVRRTTAFLSQTASGFTLSAVLVSDWRTLGLFPRYLNPHFNPDRLIIVLLVDNCNGCNNKQCSTNSNSNGRFVLDVN